MNQMPSPANRSTVTAITVFTLLTASLLLFSRLGHYALWDDEAITAMTARAVWQTGDTSVRVDDHNLLVYRNGLLVRNFKDRYTPPLQFYVIAPFIGLLGDSNFICRLPSAICGVIAVAIILRWMQKLKLSTLVLCGAAVLLLTNASFFLFFRQCRYYGLAMMLSVGVAYFYLHRNGSIKRSLILAAALAALLATQYLDYAAVVCCLVVDYAIWGRRQPMGWRGWVVLIVPQLVVGAIVMSIWNPLKHQADPYHSASWITDRFYLLLWNWRDMLNCDFAVRPLLFVCPILFIKNRSQWLLRAPLALVIFVGAIAMAVPTSLAQSHNGEVRYLAPAIPLCIGIGIVAIWGMQPLKPKLRAVLLAASAFSILVEASPTTPLLGSTALLYYHELVVPQVESYTPVIQWINTHVAQGESIYVEPQYKNYPLMFRASKATYAWQLSDPPREDFRDLPSIHFWGRIPPDYMIRFGTNGESTGNPAAIKLLAQRGIHYQLVETIHLNWKDFYRPEQIWRSFITLNPKEGDEIYIYRREKMTTAE